MPKRVGDCCHTGLGDTGFRSELCPFLLFSLEVQVQGCYPKGRGPGQGNHCFGEAFGKTSSC